jgi:hypothetical protein
MPHAETALVTALHFLIASAIGLIAAGASAPTSSNPKLSSSLLVKIGMITLVLSWLFILIGAMVSLLHGKDWSQEGERDGAGSRQYKDGTKVSASFGFLIFGEGRRGSQRERERRNDDTNDKPSFYTQSYHLSSQQESASSTVSSQSLFNQRP